MRDHTRHRRVVPIGLARLDRNTFGKVAPADPRRVETLHPRQHALDQRQRHPEPLRDLGQVGAQIAGLVDQRDQLLGDHRLQPAEALADLREQMAVQRFVLAREAVEIDALAVATRQADIVARAVVVKAFGGHIDVEIVGGAAIRRQGMVGVERCRLGYRRIVTRTVIRIARTAIAIAGRRIEQRITLERLGEIGFEFEVRQRQQLDRLLQLRRHHQRLRLAEIEARTQRHRKLPAYFPVRVEPLDCLGSRSG